MDFQTLNLLYQCSRKYGHKRIRGVGLNETEFRICIFVFYHQGCSQDDAVCSLGLDKTTVAKAMLTLEKKGMLTRRQGEEDRRKKNLFLTDRGDCLCRELGSVHDQWFRQVFSVLSDDEKVRFESLCAKVLDKAQSIIAEKE